MANSRVEYDAAIDHFSGSQFDYEQLGAELICALRGERSQSWLSRRAGYRSNMVHRWERGLCWPTAARFLGLCEMLRRDVAGSFSAFFQHTPAWARQTPIASPLVVSAFLRDLQGRAPIVELGRVMGKNRYTVSRWLNGTAEPRLPEFLHMIEASSRRLLDYLATLVDPNSLPTVRARWKQHEAAREAAYGAPWSHAVLRALETRGYRDHGAEDPMWIATHLGVDNATVDAALAALRRTGQVRRRQGRFVLARVMSTDTRRDVERARGLKEHWARVALTRLSEGRPGGFGYSLFAVSTADLARLRDLQLEYVRAMQAIIAASREPECVGLYSAALLDLSIGDDNALRIERARAAPRAPLPRKRAQRSAR